jgi:hypothetical protein
MTVTSTVLRKVTLCSPEEFHSACRILLVGPFLGLFFDPRRRRWNPPWVHSVSSQKILFICVLRLTDHNLTLHCCTLLVFRVFSLSLPHSWSRALLGKLPTVQILKNFAAFYGTLRFITMFTRALHWSLSWARSSPSLPSYLGRLSKESVQVRVFLRIFVTS